MRTNRLLSSVLALGLGAGALAFAPSATIRDGSAATGGVGDGDLTRFVEPMIGSTPPGFTNPGPALPHGMVSPGPDTEGPLNYGGYYAHNRLITGFSQTHMSAGVYQAGVFPIMPHVGAIPSGDLAQAGYPQPVPAYSAVIEPGSEIAEPGYYGVLLEDRDVWHSITATDRVALHRSEFSGLLGTPRMIVDVARSLKGYRPSRATRLDERTFLVEIDQNGPDHTVFGAVRFLETPSAVTTLAGASFAVGATIDGEGFVADFAGLDTPSVETRIGVSFTDADGALRNLAAEASDDVLFGDVQLAADGRWEDVLGLVEVTSQAELVDDIAPKADADKVRLYTALYHHRLFPNIHSDVDGRYRGPDDVVRVDTEREHYSQFSLWDSYRGQNALLAVLDPVRYDVMLRSMLDFADQNGALPRWQLGPDNPGYMSGDPAIPFIASGVCRGIGDQELVDDLLDRTLAARAARKTELSTLGYLPTAQPGNPTELADGGGRDAGTTLEFGVADAAAALLAGAAGQDDLAAEIAEDSLYYRELLDPETGYIRPRDANGVFAGGGWSPEFGYGFQEGTSHQYTWLAMHDWNGMVQRMGGDAAATEKLDITMNFPATVAHGLPWGTVQNEITAFGVFYAGSQFAPGNEHDLEIPYAYNATGAPWKAQAAARAAASVYTATADGLPGNDDLGALSGWLAWTLLGVHPTIPGAPLYLMGSPTFPHAVIHTPTGDLEINAPGANEMNKFVHGPSLGDDALDTTWFTEDAWREAGTLSMTMSATPDMTWGTSEDARPPSVTDGLAQFGC